MVARFFLILGMSLFCLGGQVLAHPPESEDVIFYSDWDGSPKPEAEEAQGFFMTDIDIIHPYIGLDLKYYRVQGYPDLFKNVLLSNYIGGDIFLGTWLYRYVGLEVGYGFTGRRTKGSTIQARYRIGPVSETFGESVVAKTGIETFYSDLNFLWPLANDYGLLATIGMGLGRPKMALRINEQDRSISEKYSGFLRGGFGLQHQVVEHIGFRALFRFEGLRTFRIQVEDANGTMQTEKPFKNGISFTLCVYMNFW